MIDLVTCCPLDYGTSLQATEVGNEDLDNASHILTLFSEDSPVIEDNPGSRFEFRDLIWALIRRGFLMLTM